MINKNSHDKLYVNIQSLIESSEAFSDVQAIGITGSIARKETTPYDKNLNDIDLFVVATSTNITKQRSLEKKLQQLTNTRFTDVTFLETNKFIKKIAKKNVDQFTFDLLSSHILLFTTNNLKEAIASNGAKSKKVLQYSKNTVLYTRLWCLLGQFHVNSCTISPREESLAIYQLKKACGAIIDAVLIHEQLYTSPRKSDKYLTILNTKFAQLNKSKILYIISFMQNDSDFSYSTYILIVNLYLSTYNYVGLKHPTLTKYPNRKAAILYFLSSRLRKHFRSTKQRFRAVHLIQRHINNSGHIDNIGKTFTDTFNNFYHEAFIQ